MLDQHLVKPNLVLLHSNLLGSVECWERNQFVSLCRVQLEGFPMVPVLRLKVDTVSVDYRN